MPELRQNLATREWVIISTERAKRPEEFVQADKERVEDRPARAEQCPFCPGNEELDLERLRLPVEGDWQVRVVRNRYPALQEQGDRLPRFEGSNYAIAGVGYHEVVVESRLHNTCPALETVDEVAWTLLASQLRGLAIREDPRIEQLIYFKNHGPTAGTSLLHPHTQLLGLPVVPYTVRTRAEEAWRYFDDHGVCVFCRMREEEQSQRARVVIETEHFAAFVPYAAFSPFHLWVVPRRHSPSFLDATQDEIRDLAIVLRELLLKLYFGLNDPDYNYVIRSAPEHERASEYLHWYLAIVPRVTRTAGFEMGSGMFINTALPEESAAFLRSVEVKSYEL
jgi:UDPglucose--hexose-1-phosphate uridylyltransferase